MGTAGGPAALRLRAEAGTEDLYYLDESGFSPTLPTGFTWARTGVRAVVKREDTNNRRVNVLGALDETGPEPELLWTTVDHKIDAPMVLDFVCTHIARLEAAPALHHRAGQRLHPPRKALQRTT
ncbi:transposase [Streptomyces klenkii]